MWNAISAIATSVGAGAAIYYVVLTHRLWRATAAQVKMLQSTRETELMLQLMTTYDRLRSHVITLRDWAGDDVRGKSGRFRDELLYARKKGDQYNIDDARYAVSRFFVMVRKLANAGFLSEDVIVSALDARAVDEVFLKLVDPLDEIAAPDSYQRIDREFFVSLLQRHY
jgi:hypothetical protein